RRLLAIARGIVGNRASSEDIVQQALLNLFRHRERYDWNEAGGLMRRAVVNEALRLLRQPRLGSVSDDLPLPDRPPAAGHGGGAEGMVQRETVVRVREAIDRLPGHFRAALVLCEYEQLSYAEIAEVLSITIPQVKTWLHRARRKLASMLDDLNEQQQEPQAEDERPATVLKTKMDA
ncbi:MAG TPA: RNA polymerase sigma factor, partial [Bradyrhizobium sp.]